MVNTHYLKQDTEYHRCGLPGEPWDIVTRFIEGGMFVNTRRYLKRCTMIDKRHPSTRSFAPSLYRLKQEEKIHLIENYNMIHPLSMFSFYFNMVICFMLLFYYLFVPIMYPLTNDKMLLMSVMLPTNVVYTLVIIVSFHTGYYDHSNNVIIMNRCEVAKLYLRTYFVFDVLTFIPQTARFVTDINFAEHSTYYFLPPMLTLLRYVSKTQRYNIAQMDHLIQYMESHSIFDVGNFSGKEGKDYLRYRYMWCVRVLNNMRLYYGLTTFAMKTIQMLLHVLIVLTLAVYVLFALLTEIPYYDTKEFLKHAASTLNMLLLVSFGRCNEGKMDVVDLLVPCGFLLMGFIFHLVILVQVMEIWFRYFSARNQQNTVYDSIQAYMRYKALPVSLRRRIDLYLEFKYQGYFYKESVIRKATSSYLRKEVLLAATKKSILQVELFRRIPHGALRKIRSNLTSEIFLPRDIIIRAGNTGQCMFFLLAGTVLVTGTDDKEICYLRDGAHFGEVALVVNIARVANVIAITPCELFKLDRQTFCEVVQNYPDLWKEIEEMVHERIATSAHSNPVEGNSVRYPERRLTHERN